MRGRYQGRRGAIRDATLKGLPARHRELLAPDARQPAARGITAPEIKTVIGEIARRDDKRYLTDRSIRRLFAPLQALLATAVEEGVIAHNPARDGSLPSGRDALRQFEQDDEDDSDPDPGNARALTESQVAAFLLVVDARWRLFFDLLAGTGLRVSEALALRWRDLKLDGDRPAVRVRRAYVEGTFAPPKSRYGRRDVPISFELVRALRERRKDAEWHGVDDLVWPSLAGTPMEQDNLRRWTLVPAAQEAGVSWAGFHAFRHSAASRLIASGRNIVQVSRWLGHHWPSFTLNVYAHLMEDGVGEPLEKPGGNGVATHAPDTSRNADVADLTVSVD